MEWQREAMIEGGPRWEGKGVWERKGGGGGKGYNEEDPEKKAGGCERVWSHCGHEELPMAVGRSSV